MDYTTTTTTTSAPAATTMQSSNNKSTSSSTNCSSTNKANSSINNGFTNINNRQQQHTTAKINNSKDVQNLNNKCPSSPVNASTTINSSIDSAYDEINGSSGSCVDEPETSLNFNKNHNNVLVVDENQCCNNNKKSMQINDYSSVENDNFYINNSSDRLIDTEFDEEESLLHNGYATSIICDSISNSLGFCDNSGGENKLNCDDTLTQPLLCREVNGFCESNKRPKSIVKSTSATSFPEQPVRNEVERPVLHVQFSQSEELPGYSQHENGKNPPQLNTPTGSILSSSSSSSSSEEDSEIPVAPDGGWGWVVVFASFMVNLIADGITFSFGVIFVEFLNYFEESKGKTAWIGSLFMAMPLLSGPIASFLTDRYGCRKVTIAGSILAAIGFVISAFAQNMEILFFTFGILSGFGLSLCYVAAVVIVAYYFDKKRSFATGLAVCGSGIGTFIFAPLIQILLNEYGWRGTTLILAGIFLNMCVCGMLMKDLEWTKQRAKLRRRKRKRGTGISAESFSVSNSTNTAGTIGNLTGVIPEEKQVDADNMDPDDPRLFSSLITLPTYIRNGEKVPVEVLELLSRNRNVHNVLLHNYPSLCHSRSFSEPLSSKNNILSPGGTVIPASSPIDRLKSFGYPVANDANQLPWLRRGDHMHHRNIRAQPNAAYLKDLRMHRHSLTYRGAMLNINRYRLRASSCPDIYRNSMTTIAKEKTSWYQGIDDFKDLLVDILDFSYFLDIKFSLFVLSNFLLYMWYDVPYVYITDYAIEQGFSDTDGSMLVSVIGIVNMVGEIILGWAGDKESVSANFIYAVSMGMCGLITGLVPLVKSYSSLATLSGFFGLFIAANYSLTSIILVELITIEKFTNAYGLLLLVQGIGNLVGPPLAGWIYDVTSTYDLSFYLAGFFIVLSGLLLLILPAIKRYKALKKPFSQTDVENNKIKINSIGGKLPKIDEIPSTKSNTILSDCFGKDLLKDGIGVKV